MPILSERPGLLRTPEETAVDCLREDVALNRFHHTGAGFEGVGGWFYVQFDIEREGIRAPSGKPGMVRVIAGREGAAPRPGGCAGSGEGSREASREKAVKGKSNRMQLC
jgi:hypothetical protein